MSAPITFKANLSLLPGPGCDARETFAAALRRIADDIEHDGGCGESGNLFHGLDVGSWEYNDPSED